MRISDWSSDVCSSDLRTPPLTNAKSRIDRRRGHGRRQCPVTQGVATSDAFARILLPAPRSTFPPQSEFRRLFDNRSVAELLISVTENRNGNGVSSKICS